MNQFPSSDPQSSLNLDSKDSNGRPELDDLLQRMDEMGLDPKTNQDPSDRINPERINPERINPERINPERINPEQIDPVQEDIDARIQAVRQRQQQSEGWGLSTKVTLGAIALSTIPLMILGGILYGQSLRDRSSTFTSEEVQQNQRNLGLGAGAAAIAAGAIAALFAQRTTRSVEKAASVSNNLVNRLRRETTIPRDRVTGKDELIALESNLRILGEQLPSLLSNQEAEAARLKVLMEVTQRLRESRSEEDVLRIAVTEVRQRFRTDRVTVFQFQESGEGVFVEESLSQGWPKLLWSTVHDPCFSEGYIDKYREGHVRAIDNIYEAGLGDCHVGLLERFGVKANLVAPIIKDSQLFGLFIAHQCSAPRFWQTAEIDLFAQIATQIGFALDHARLLEEVDQRATRSQSFIDIARQIRASLNTEEVLKTTVNEVRKAINADRVVVYGFDDQWYGTVMAEAVLAGYPKALWAKIKDPCFVEGYIDKYQSGRVQATANVQEAGLTDCHLKQLEPFAVKANLVAPILKDNQLFGLLIAHQCSGPRQWQSPEIDWFAQIATQVGFAMDHARLLEQVNAESIQSKALSDITRRIRTSLIEDEVLKTTVTETRRVFQTDRVMVYSFDDQWYGTVVAEAVLPGYPKALRARIKDPCFAEGYVDQYREGRVQAISNIETAGLTRCHLEQLEPFSVRANLVAPILKDDKLFGLLIAHQCSGPRDWQPTEVELFSQIAMQVGFALDHARLLDQVEQAYQVAAESSEGQRHQRETLQQEVLGWLNQSEPAVKALSSDMLKQMESITTIYQHLKTFSAENQSILASLSQQETQKHQAQQALQKSHAIAEALQQRMKMTQEGLTSAAQQVQQLSNPAQKLSEVTQFIHQMTSQMKLQAMNAALEASRMGDSGQEFAGIGERVLDLARQLESKTAELTTAADTLQSQLLVAVSTLQDEAQQVESGLQLGGQAGQTLAQMVATNAQFQTWLQSMVESAQRQSDLSLTANQLILEVASRANQASEQAIAISSTLDQLTLLSHEETTP
jgi:methyl-accepting chemotaxis protein PixJ